MLRVLLLLMVLLGSAHSFAQKGSFDAVPKNTTDEQLDQQFSDYTVYELNTDEIFR